MIARVALRFTAWAERWLPDAFVFALVATLLVLRRGAGARRTRGRWRSSTSWGKGFWELVPVHDADGAGHRHRLRARVLAPGGAGHRAARAAAADGARGAVVMVALFSMLRVVVQLGLLAHLRGAARARDRAAPARGGLPGAGGVELPRPGQRLGAGAERVGGAADGDAGRAPAEDPRHRGARGASCRAGSSRCATTIFTWQSSRVGGHRDRRRTARGGRLHAAGGAREDGGGARGAAGAAGRGGRRRATARSRRASGSSIRRCSTWPSSRWAARTWCSTWRGAKDGLSALNVNTINLAFLMLGVVLHGTPARLMRAVRDATPATWGVHPAVSVLRGHRGDDRRTRR